MLKAIHAQEDRQAAREKAAQVVEKLETLKLREAAAILRDGVEETLFYMAFPREHWRDQHQQHAGADYAGDSRERMCVGNFPDGSRR